MTYEEAYEKSLKYFQGDEMATSTFLSKYAMRDSEGNYLEATPDDMHRRLAKELARIEKNYKDPLSEEEIYQELKDFGKVIPQGSIMSVLGTGMLASLSNCVVLPAIPDSYGGIAYADQQLMHLMKRRCGVGLDISTLRPSGTEVSNSAGTSTGAVSFMERFSNTTREVAQCIEQDQRVLTEDGLKPIRDVEPGDKVWTRKGFIKVVNNHKNGHKDVVRVTTKSGLSILTTEEHVFRSVRDGEIDDRKLGDLFEGGIDGLSILPGTFRGEGDPVKLVQDVELPKRSISNSLGEHGEMEHNRYKEVSLPESLNEDLAYLVGYSFGNGYVEKPFKSLSVSVPNSKELDTMIKERIIETTREQFGHDPAIKDGDGACEGIQIGNQTIGIFLSNNGLLKETAESIDIPQVIWDSPDSVKAEFLSGFFDADGYASGSKKGYVFATVSDSFAEDIQKMLLSIGVPSKIHKEDRSDKGWHTLYSVCVVGSTSQKRFTEIMDSVKVSDKGWVAKRDCWKTIYNSKEAGLDYNKYPYIPNPSYKMSFSAFDRCPDSPDEDALLFDQIESITPEASDYTHDLELEEEHLFWCEGFYVHNSGRRGALMITMDIRHPDIENFVEMKQDLEKVTGANISVRITDEFMRAVENDDAFELRYPVDMPSSEDPDPFGDTYSNDKKMRVRLNARNLWDKIVSCAHNTAEPGIIFWDRQDDYSPSSVYPGFENVSTNPCSEIAMQGNDTCRLTAINLTGFIKDPFTDHAQFDHEAFSRSVRKAVRLMDDIVDLEIEQIDKILEKVHNDPEDDKYKQVELDTWRNIRDNAVKGRRTGLGITGLGDTLAMLGFDYDSEDGKAIIEQIMGVKFDSELEEQMNLAEERGAFPAWDLDMETLKPMDSDDPWDDVEQAANPFYRKMFSDLYYGDQLDRYMRSGRRNISWSTVAPTGSLSVMAQVTSGIEPLFAPYYTRRKKINPDDENVRVDFVDQNGDSWQEFPVIHPSLEKFALESEQEKQFKDTLILGEGTADLSFLQDKNKLEEKFQESPYYGNTAPEIDWIDRVDVQSIVQKYTTHSISSTINLPSDVSVDKVKEIYMKAWKKNLKGITVYRDGARSGVLINKDQESSDEFPEHDAPDRPKTLDADVYHSKSEGKEWVICVGLLNDKPFEVFAYPKNGEEYPPHRSRARITKKGSGKFILHDDEKEYVNLAEVMDEQRGAVTILASGMLQHGAKVDFVNKRLKKADPNITSFVKAVQMTLRRYNVEDDNGSFEDCDTPDQCQIVHEEGCVTCRQCLRSKCS